MQIKINPKIGLTSPKISHTMCYSFEFDEKIIRSLNKLSRNFEFHQPECLKCLLMRGHIFGGGIWQFVPKSMEELGPCLLLHEK